MRAAFTAMTILGTLALLGSGPSEEVSFSKDIAPIFAAKCVSCHSPGGAGPFSLQTYAQVHQKADLIQTVLLLQKMPPAQAVSDFGPVTRHLPLTDHELVAYQSWFRGKTPEGPVSASKVSSSPPWQLGVPDSILRSPNNIVVPAEGPEATRMAMIPFPLESTKYLTAFDIRPWTPGAFRQATLALQRPGDDSAFTSTGIQAKRLIGAWSLDSFAWKLPEGSGIELKPGTKIAVRMLYHPTGKRENGGFDVALYFSKQIPRRQPVWLTLGSREFEILSGEALTTLSASLKIGEPMRIVSVVPEARNLAIWMKLSAGSKTVLEIPRWQRRWVGAYNFPSFPVIDAADTIQAQIQYDNTNHGDPSLTLNEIKRLPKNPVVRFGSKEADELFWVHVQMVPNS